MVRITREPLLITALKGKEHFIIQMERSTWVSSSNTKEKEKASYTVRKERKYMKGYGRTMIHLSHFKRRKAIEARFNDYINIFS